MSNFDERDDLSRELRTRSHDVGGHPIGLDGVKRSARKIQRRRRIATGAVAAAVFVVAVPTALAVTSGFNQGTDPVSPPTPSVTESTAPRPEGPVRLTTKELPRGEDPQLSYIIHATQELVTPDGTLPLPQAYTMMTPFRDGWLALGSQSGDGLEALWLDADLNVVRSRPTIGSTLAASDDGDQVAWTEAAPDSRKSKLVSAPAQGGDPQSWQVPSNEEVIPVGFVGDGRVVFTDVVTSLNGITEPDGGITELDGFLHLADASETSGLVSGLTRFGSAKVCSGVMDPASSTSEMLWETCAYKLGAFSPNGRYVIGTPSDADALGSPSVAVLDAQSGEVLVEFKPGRNDPISMYQLAWEDDQNIIAMTIAGTDVMMIRLTLGGETEQVGSTGESTNMSVPFWFAETRR